MNIYADAKSLNTNVWPICKENAWIIMIIHPSKMCPQTKASYFNYAQSYPQYQQAMNEDKKTLKTANIKWIKLSQEIYFLNYDWIYFLKGK